jgi:hypothetical protein
VRAQREVVVLLTSEPREVVDDYEMDFALVDAAVLQQVLRLTAVRALGALAFLVEAFKNLVALAAAPARAGTLLVASSATPGSFR